MPEDAHTLFERLMQELTDTAMEDGKITAEEQAILNRVASDISLYQKVLEKAVEDGVITQSERFLLDSMRTKVTEGAASVARRDRTVSEDERALLSRLFQVMINHRKELK